MLWNENILYKLANYKSEDELEQTIQKVKDNLFGQERIYINTKKRIGKQGKKENIPDGYLIDLTSLKNPQLYVVEVELAKHHPLKHIAVQILEFNIAFEDDPQRVKSVLRKALDNDKVAHIKCNEYARNNGFQNIDYFLERMIYDRPFAALVIIDDIEDDLKTVLGNKFNFSVDAIPLKRYVSSNGEFLYEFEPFLLDVEQASPYISGKVSVSDIDTIVVPARDDGFKEVFLGENRWYAIRINQTIIPRIKYIAVYNTAPISAITHYAEVDNIKPWKDSGKYVVNFYGKSKPIQPIKLTERIKAPQAPRYTTFEKLKKAKNLDDVF